MTVPRSESTVVASKQAWLNAELEVGESLLFVAEPRARGLGGPQQIGPFLFAIPWTAFALFWTVSAFTMTGSGGDGFGICFAMFGLPFVAVGVFMLSGPIRHRLALGATVYGITDRRVLIVEPSGMGSRRVRSFTPGQLRPPERVDHADGSSDLIFAQTVHTGQRGGTYTTPDGFFGIEAGREAEGYLRLLLESGAPTGA